MQIAEECKIKIMENFNEYETLKSFLDEKGLYERGMEIEEMRKVADAIYESMISGEIEGNSFPKDDNNETVKNRHSTTNSRASISHNNCNVNRSRSSSSNSNDDFTQFAARSPSVSPCSFETFITCAQVHHDANYNPQQEQKDQLQLTTLNPKGIVADTVKDIYNEDEGSEFIAH